MNLRTLSHLPDDLGTLGAPAVITPADEAEPVKEPATPFERYMRSTTLPDNWERALEQTFDAGRTLGREEMREAEKQAKSQDAVVRRPIWESGSNQLPKPPLGNRPPTERVKVRTLLKPGQAVSVRALLHPAVKTFHSGLIVRCTFDPYNEGLIPVKGEPGYGIYRFPLDTEGRWWELAE